MPGDAGLRGGQGIHDIPNTEFPTLQDLENPQPRSVRKSPKHQVDTVQCLALSGLHHIRNVWLEFA